MEQSKLSAAPSSPAPRKRGVLTALLYLGVYLLAQGLSIVLFSGYLAIRLSQTPGGLDPAALMSSLQAAVSEQAIPLSVCSNLLSISALALAVRLRKQTLLAAVGYRPLPLSRLWPLLPLGAALNALLSTLISLLPQSLLSAYTEASSVLLTQTGLLPLLAVAFLGPVTEEILFRGLLYQNLKSSMPRFLAMLLSSAAFGLFHGQLVWIVYAFLAGLLFCFAADRYESLAGSLLLHIAFNFSSGLVFPLSTLPAPWVLAVSAAVCGLSLWLVLQKTRQNAPTA